VLDEFSHECLAIRVARKLKPIDVIDVLSDLFIYGAFPLTSDPTTDPSSSPRHCRNGSRLSVHYDCCEWSWRSRTDWTQTGHQPASLNLID
jgi:hypothetical protein